MRIHLRQRSQLMKLGSDDFPSPRWHRKRGGSNSEGVKDHFLANKEEMVMCVIGVPLSMCACAM